MLSPRQVVDYALQRRAQLASVRDGRVGLEEACDAGAYLLRAARFHGVATRDDCPICEREHLVHVSWVFGESLRHVSGSARPEPEIAALAETHPEFTVHVVEVCRGCGWNHLVRSYVLGTGRSARRRPGRRSAGG
ncbi:DUF5318 family protein [Pseudonocardia phyllosphaerae]|uniref:DUF5318 family protein n=1 Tax=Pseudonocardia phyllosphaerae TaxID=3390502 RepID=UPI00397A4306